VPGAKLASQLAMPLSADTLLRGVRAQPLPPPPEPPRTVGVDDWALRKGRTYGSVLVDLDRRRVLDLRPNRSAPTFANWLERHPHVATIARDRSTEYARGAALGAPDAVQVADRWHLLFNTRQMVERWLVRAYPRLRRLPPPVSAPPAASFRRGRAYPRARSEALARAQARGRWEALYDEVRRRHAAGGQPLRSIHRETGLARATVRKYALSDSFPRHGLRGPTPSILDPFLPHLQARWDEGCENAMALWREVVALGFPATPKQVRRWLSERRRQPAKTTPHTRRAAPIRRDPAAPPALPSPKQLSWLLVREPEDLSASETGVVARLEQDDGAATVAALARRFCAIVRRAGLGGGRSGSAVADFDAWLAEARACGIRVVESFAAGLDQDGAAVRAALRLPWSSGQAEGQINRLKLLKRAMYGGAKLDLLRRRLILAA
jgi:transposase